MAKRATTLLLSLLLLIGTTACAEQDNSDAESAAGSDATQTTYVESDTQAVDGSDAQNQGLIERAGDLASDTANAAADAGAKAWDTTTDKAAEIGDAAVDASKSALDTVGDAAAAAGDTINDALDVGDNEQAEDRAGDTVAQE